MFGRRRAREGGVELALGHLDVLYSVALTTPPFRPGELRRPVRRLTDRQACKAVLYKIMLRLWRKRRQRAPHEVRLPDPADDPSWALPGAGRGGLRGDDDPEAAVRPHAFVVAVDRALASSAPLVR